MGTPAGLDHVVINVLYEMDRAAAAFAALGFTLTPRGFHSLGSINHLMIFGSTYLELIGLPEGIEAPRPEIVQSPLGLNGLVFKTDDADATYAQLQAVGLAGDAPMAFTRPVALEDGEATARFRTVMAAPGSFEAGRVYFCEHGTPELVWRPEWAAHANGATAIADFVVVAEAVEEVAERLAKTARARGTVDGADGRVVELGAARLSVLLPARYRARFGALALPMGGRGAIFGAVTIATTEPDAARAAAEAAGNPLLAEAGRVVVRVPELNALIEFRA